MSSLRPGDYDDIWGLMIDKLADVYQKAFPVRSKNQVHHFVAGELLLVFKCATES